MLRFGAVGVGGFLEGTIAPAIAAEPDSELAAVVSRDPARADTFAARWGVPNAYTSYEDMLSSPEVDAVYIATPNSLHADQVVAAAGAGKHVFCEKPLANNAADAARASSACETAGVRLGIDFHNRYVPWVRDVTAMIAAGDIGDVRVVEVDVGSGPRHYDNWRADPEVAGLGSVHNVGVHALDFLGVLLDAMPLEVAAMFDPDPARGAVEMLGMILIRFDNGTIAYLNCNETLENPTNAIKLYGSKGRIIGSSFTRSRVGGDLSVVIGEEESRTHYPAAEAHRLCLAAFTAAVLGERDPVPSGVDGLRSAQICEAIARSVRERRIVTVDYGTK